MTTVVVWTLVLSLTGDTTSIVIHGYPTEAACYDAGSSAKVRGYWYCIKSYRYAPTP